MPKQSQANGIMGRSLLPFDMLAYVSDPERRHWEPSFLASMKVGDDLLDRNDIGPFGFGLVLLRHILDIGMWRKALRIG